MQQRRKNCSEKNRIPLSTELFVCISRAMLRCRSSGEPYLIINSNADELIDHLLPASNIVPTYSPNGKTLISVNIVGNREVSDDILQEKVKAELTKWFGKNIAWRHLKTYRITDALPQFIGDSAAGKHLKINEHLYRCGDYTAYPSLNAAMKTGREVAEMLHQ